MEQTQFRSGTVALVGKPNVGKSTLLNALLKQKISIVSPLPQTTRHQFAGILTTDTSQLIFLDTPGLLNPKYELHQYMLQAALSSLETADVIVHLTDAQAVPEQLYEDIPSTIKHVLKNRALKGNILIINKVDLIRKENLLPQIEYYNQLRLYNDIVPISALKEIALDQLLDVITKSTPPGPMYYPADQLANVSERFISAEFVREQVFLQIHDEIPYATTVMIQEFKDRGEKLYINAVIYVMKASQKAVLIGKKGGQLKKIGQAARIEIEQFLGKPVYLEIWVKVRETWRTNTSELRHFGYN